MSDYLLGVTTPFVVAPVVLGILLLIEWLRDTSSAYGCGTCGRWWGPRYDGSRSRLAQLRRWWHAVTSHPGYRGRRLVACWRGVDLYHDRRLDRMFPNPPVTAWDVLARIPIIDDIAFAIAARHGRKTR